ncbi:MAG: hypothetical protein ABIG89_01995 [Candidatus Woesearchaeota archaeon]
MSKKNNKHHPKHHFRKSLIFISLIIAIFTISMLATNLKNEDGQVDLSKSKILNKISKELAAPITNLLSIGKGETESDVYINPNDPYLHVHDTPDDIKDDEGISVQELLNPTQQVIDTSTEVRREDLPTNAKITPIVKPKASASGVAGGGAGSVTAAKQLTPSSHGYKAAAAKVKELGKTKDATLLTQGGYSFKSDGKNRWTVYKDGQPYKGATDKDKVKTLTTDEMINLFKDKNCATGKCLYESGKDVSIFGVKMTAAKPSGEQQPQTQNAPAKPETQPEQKQEKPITVGYDNLDNDGDLRIQLKQNGKEVGVYFFRDAGLFKDELYKLNPKTGEKELCVACEVKKAGDKWQIIDRSRDAKSGQVFDINAKKSPEDTQEEIIIECGKGDNIKSAQCTGTAALFTKLYDRLDFEFRSQVEPIFATLFEKWTDGWLGSRLEHSIYSSMCKIKYYQGDDAEQPLLLGAKVDVPTFQYDMDGTRDLFIVNIGGEKEQITESVYRYAFTVKLIGQMHYVIYLQNTCTGKKSFDFGTTGGESKTTKFSWKDYFEGKSSASTSAAEQKTVVKGWREEGVLGHKGVKVAHYAGDDMVYNCDEVDECRFNQACVKIIEDQDSSGSSGQPKHPDSYCIDLNSGIGFYTEGETGSLEC